MKKMCNRNIFLSELGRRKPPYVMKMKVQNELIYRFVFEGDVYSSEVEWDSLLDSIIAELGIQIYFGTVFEFGPKLVYFFENQNDFVNVVCQNKENVFVVTYCKETKRVQAENGNIYQTKSEGDLMSILDLISREIEKSIFKEVDCERMFNLDNCSTYEREDI